MNEENKQTNKQRNKHSQHEPANHYVATSVVPPGTPLVSKTTHPTG